MNEEELRAFLNLMMTSDPWPTSQEEHLTMLAYAEKEAKAHGFADWIDAYHKLNEER